MAKKTNGAKKVSEVTAKAVKDNSMTMAAIQVFLGGALAEIWLMIIRRYYVNGTVDELLSFGPVLQTSTYVGLGILALGLVLTLIWRGNKKRAIGLWTSAIGAFVAAAGWICYAVYPNGTTIMGTITAVVTLLALAFLLYQREFVWSASILGVGVLSLWVCRKGLGNLIWNTRTIVGAVVVMVVLVALLLALRKAEKSAGRLGNLQLLPAGASYSFVYASITATVVSIALGLLSATLAYYLMWALVLCIFALVVYYTVKQL